jgi:hypothetical protein
MESSSSGGGMANGTANHPLLSPCGAMEEASSPGIFILISIFINLKLF